MSGRPKDAWAAAAPHAAELVRERSSSSCQSRSLHLEALPDEQDWQGEASLERFLQEVSALQSRHEDRMQLLFKGLAKDVERAFASTAERTSQRVPNAEAAASVCFPEARLGESCLPPTCHPPTLQATGPDAHQEQAQHHRPHQLMKQEAENYLSKKMTIITALGSQHSAKATLYAKHAIYSRWFELCMTSVVLFDALVLGLQADWQVKHVQDSAPRVFLALNRTCTALFTVEILLRIVAEKKDFVMRRNRNFAWNIFDATVLLLAWCNELVQLLFVDFASVSFVRLFRVLRLAKVLRMVRLVRMLNELRVMVIGVFSSLRPLAWALLLLGLIMYTFAVIVLQFVADRLADSPSDDKVAVDLRQFYSSLRLTVTTLWMAISGGLDWGNASEPLRDISAFLEVCFILYVAFSLLCVLNIVTGVFVENANKSFREDEAQLMLEDALARKQAMEHIRRIFLKADSDGSGEVDWEEFQEAFGDPQVQHWFKHIGVHVESESALGLFELLDFDSSGKINLDEFAMACSNFSGIARSIDLVRIHNDVRKLREEMLEHFIHSPASPS